jgi:hypothetical protein
MPLPRLHLFELEDQPWFPAVIRDLATDYLRHVESKFALHRCVVGSLADVLRETGQTQVVDLCAGGGGPIPSLQKELAGLGVNATFVLTDRFPNHDAFEAVAAQSDETITFRTDSIDARAVPRDLAGVRTMFNAFHHFAPADAMAVLRNAVDAGQPIAIFEVPDRRLAAILPLLLFVPFVVAAVTPFVRPFRWSRLFWTYVIPLVPLTVWWDGVVSQLRAYTVAELERLVAEFPGYTWKAGTVPVGTVPGRLTYLTGWPKA